MSENSFDHSSSVHLRDLSKLVFAFSTEEKNQSIFQVNDNPQDSNLHACFGVSNTGIDTKKDEAITLQTSTRDDYAALDQNQRDLILEQSFDGNVEEVDMEEELSSGSCAETDPDETQTETKNSLHLITELCDRLLSRDGKRFEDVPRPGNTVNTPYTSERLNYSSTHETIAHCISTICSSDDGFYQPSSLYSCAMNNTYKEWPDSINEQNGAATLCIANTRYSTYNNQQNHVAKRLQSFETSELSCAISNIQQMLAQISPPAHSVTGSLSQISEHNGQLPSNEIIQCISIKEPFTGANVLATSSPQASSSSAAATNQNSPGKYSELLAVIEELGKDIRPTYAGSKNAAERLKKGIMHARVLVRECLVETDKCARQ